MLIIIGIYFINVTCYDLSAQSPHPSVRPSPGGCLDVILVPFLHYLLPKV